MVNIVLTQAQLDYLIEMLETADKEHADHDSEYVPPVAYHLLKTVQRNAEKLNGTLNGAYRVSLFEDNAADMILLLLKMLTDARFGAVEKE